MSDLKLQTLLCTYPIESHFADFFAHLRAIFGTVIFVPGEDGSGTETEYDLKHGVQLPTDEDYARADVILAFIVPPNLHSISQGPFSLFPGLFSMLISSSAVPKLKLWQVVGSGTAPITNSEFYKSIPPSSPLVFSNLAGVHSVSIAEHGASVLSRHNDTRLTL